MGRWAGVEEQGFLVFLLKMVLLTKICKYLSFCFPFQSRYNKDMSSGIFYFTVESIFCVEIDDIALHSLPRALLITGD